METLDDQIRISWHGRNSVNGDRNSSTWRARIFCGAAGAGNQKIDERDRVVPRQDVITRRPRHGRLAAHR